MEFKFIDLDELTENDLITVLNHNVRCASLKRKEISKLKQATTSSESKINVITQEKKKAEAKVEEVEDITFENKVKQTIKSIKNIPFEELEESIYGALPSQRDYGYEKIILRVILEFKKEINDINEIIVADLENISKQDLEEFLSEVKEFEKCIQLLKNVLKEEKQADADDDVDNTLIFIPTTSGNPRLIDDIKDIPIDFYDEFLELYESIIDGTFKKSKRFDKNNKLKGLREVKGDHLRITYVKLGKNTYGILTAFMKKTNSDHGYRNMLYTRYKDYKNNVKDKLIGCINDEEFIKIHNGYKLDVFRILGVEKSEETQKVKKGNE